MWDLPPPLPVLSLSLGWTSWHYTVATLLAPSPFALSLALGRIPDLVHHLPYQGLQIDPVTSPRLCLQCSAPTGPCFNGESTACARSPSAPVLTPSWGSLFLSSPSHSLLSLSVMWGHAPPHQAFMLLWIFQTMRCLINFATKIMGLSKNIC